MHPYLHAPHHFLTALGRTAQTPLHQLPTTGERFEVRLPDLQVEFPSARRVRVSWTAGGQTVHVTVPRKRNAGFNPEQWIRQRVAFGEAQVEVRFQVGYPCPAAPSGAVHASVPGAFAQALSLLPLSVWENVRPATSPLPRWPHPAQATPLPGRPDLELTVTPGDLPMLGRVNGVPVEVINEAGGLGIRVHVDNEPVILLSLDAGRSWTLHSQAPGPGLVYGLSADEAALLRSRHTPRRFPPTTVLRDPSTQEWVLREPDGHELRVPILLHEKALRLHVAVELEDGQSAGTRVLDYGVDNERILTPSLEAIAALRTHSGDVLHVSALLEPVTDGQRVQSGDIAFHLSAADQPRGSGQWEGRSLLLARALLSLLRRLTVEEIAQVLPFTSREATASLDETGRSLVVRAYGRVVATVSPQGIVWAEDLREFPLENDALSVAARRCESREAHEVFRLLTELAVLQVGEREALVVPVAPVASPA